MKKLFPLFILLLTLFTACQKRETRTIEVYGRPYQKFQELKTDSGYVRDGKFQQWYLTGQLEMEGTLKNNQRDGKWTFYYPNGNIEQEFTMTRDTLDGWYRSYTMEGKLKSSYEVMMGNREGNSVLYDKNGNVVEEGVYQNNLKQGIWNIKGEKLLYINGNLASILGTWVDQEGYEWEFKNDRCYRCTHPKFSHPEGHYNYQRPTAIEIDWKKFTVDTISIDFCQITTESTQFRMTPKRWTIQLRKQQ